MITISNQPALPANVLTNREGLTYESTTQTGLRCATRVNFHQQPTSLFRFVGQHVQEVRPSRIVDRPAQGSASQPFDIQVLDSNQPILVNDLSRFLVVKIAPLISNMVVKSLQQENRLAPAIRSSLASRDASLKPAQFCLSRIQPTRILNLCSVTEGSERGQAHVDANHTRAKGQRPIINTNINAKSRKPAASLALHRKSLNVAVHWAMQLNADLTNFAQAKFISIQRIPDLTKPQTVIPPRRAEARVSRLLSRPNTLEECGEREMHPMQRILQCAHVHALYVFADLSYLGYLRVLMKPRDRLAFTLPRLPPFLKCRIIEFCANHQLTIKDFFLSLGGVDPVTEGFYHTRILQNGFSLSEEKQS